MPPNPKKKKVRPVTAPIKKVKRKEEPNINNITEIEGEIDFDKLVKNEYLKLQRQYRLMEDKRHAITGAGNAHSKQSRRLVEIFQHEEEDMETNLYNAEAPCWVKIDRESRKTILEILENYERANAESSFALKNIREMSSHVDKITRQLVEHKLKVQAIYGQSMTVQQANRKNGILENRLYLYTTKFDTKLSCNKSLREEINMMLKLRGLFYQRLMSMRYQLAKIRLKMTEIVFTSTSAYEQRDELVYAIRNLRDKNDKDTRQHVLEIKEFHRVLHHDAKTREFNALKNKERQLLESARQRDARRNLAKITELDRVLATYAKSFRYILKFSQYESLESLIKHYSEMEQANFARFVAISDVNHEVTALRDETIMMGQDIDKLFHESKTRDLERSSELELEEKKIGSKDAEFEENKNVLEKTETQFQAVLETIKLLFDAINCSTEPIESLLGNPEGSGITINARNALLCANCIETRARELLLEKSVLELRKMVEIENVPLARAAATRQGAAPKKHSGGPFSPTVIVAGRVDGEDEEEDDDRGLFPLVISDFRQKVLEKILAKRASESHVSHHNMGGNYNYNNDENSINPTPRDSHVEHNSDNGPTNPQGNTHEEVRETRKSINQGSSQQPPPN